MDSKINAIWTAYSKPMLLNLIASRLARGIKLTINQGHSTLNNTKHNSKS